MSRVRCGDPKYFHCCDYCDKKLFEEDAKTIDKSRVFCGDECKAAFEEEVSYEDLH